jgi:hypothetical protein
VFELGFVLAALFGAHIVSFEEAYLVAIIEVGFFSLFEFNEAVFVHGLVLVAFQALDLSFLEA